MLVVVYFVQNFCAAKTVLATWLKGANATGGILTGVYFPSASKARWFNPYLNTSKEICSFHHRKK